MGKTALLALVLGATTVTAQDYTGALKGLWKQSDKDGDKLLDLTEFKDACSKMDLAASDLKDHATLDAFFTSIDSNGDGKLTEKELADSMTTYPDYKSVLRSKFTNGAGEVPSGIQQPSESVAKALAKVVMNIEVAGKPSDLYAGTRRQIKEYFADKCGVTAAEVIMTFLPKAVADASGRRKLQTADATVIKGTAFVADNAAAEAAQAALPTDAAGFEAVPAFSGLSVTSVEITAKKELSIPIPEAVGTGAALLVIGLIMCFLASKFARKGSQGVTPRGCCSTGCCSFYAVKSWAFAEFVALIAFAGCLVFLFTRMSALTTTVDGLIQTLLDLTSSTVSAIKDLTASLPTSIISTIEQQRAQIQLLPIAVMVPGALCIIFLLLACLCPLSKGHKGSYCWSKCFIMLANVFLLVSFIFYIIFVAIAAVIQFGPPQIKDQLRQITGLCDTVPPAMQQLVADNKAGLDLLVAAGQPESSLANLRTVLDDVESLTTSIAKGCTHLNQLFVDVFNLFLPGLMCIVAIVFAMFVNNTLCCAEGCCKAPPKDGLASPGVEMTPAKGADNGETTQSV